VEGKEGKGKRKGREGMGREGRKDEGKWYPHFLGESYAPACQSLTTASVLDKNNEYTK